jgi:excisionase family DNA binding protein
VSEDVPPWGSTMDRVDRRTNMLTVEQAAALLAVRPKTVRALAAGGIIPAVKVGKFWRFDEGLLREWLQAQSRANVREASAPIPAAPGEVSGRSSIGRQPLSDRLDAILAATPEVAPVDRRRRRPQVSTYEAKPT